MASDGPLVTTESLSSYFRELLETAMTRQQAPLNQVTAFYLVDLLSRFTDATALYVQKPDGTLDEEPLAFQLQRALEGTREERVAALRKLGDSSLYVAGFFGDSLQNRVVDLDYYIAMGSGVRLAGHADARAAGRRGLHQPLRRAVREVHHHRRPVLGGERAGGGDHQPGRGPTLRALGQDRLGAADAAARRAGRRPGAGQAGHGAVMLAEIQRALEIMYGVRAPRAVEDFVVSEAALALLGRQARSGEELLVVSGREELELALYISPDVLARLPELWADTPRGFLEQLLPAFCTAAEGVSHFVFLTLQTLRDRAVSLLELEAQAEVDKFATALLHLWKHGERRRSGELRERLFDRVGYRAGLSGEQEERYVVANRLARTYAASLEARFVLGDRLEALLAELRRTYRLPCPQKLAWLAQHG